MIDVDLLCVCDTVCVCVCVCVCVRVPVCRMNIHHRGDAYDAQEAVLERGVRAGRHVT